MRPILAALALTTAAIAPALALSAATGQAAVEPNAIPRFVLAQADATPAAEPALPDALRGLGLTDIRTRLDDDRETYVSARLPNGGWLRAELVDERLVEAQSGAVALPAALVARMLPQAVRDAPQMSELDRITKIDLDDDDIEIEGLAADGMRIELEFSQAGRLRDFERERDDRRSLDEDTARARLEALGYTEIGGIERGGRHVEALARNAYGDLVEVRLDEAGRVERERLWAR